MPTQRITLAQDVLIQDLAGEAVLLNLKNEQYFGLDEIGTRMLTVLQETDSFAEACDLLLEEYDVDADRLSTDLLQFVNELVKHGLVEVTSTEN